MRLFALLFALSCCAAQAQMQAKLLAVESLEDFQLWLERKPAPDEVYPHLHDMVVGKKVHFPILATGLRPPERGEMKLVADVEFVGPDGKVIVSMQACCSYTITNRPDIRTVMLGPTPGLTPEARDTKGIYTIRVAISDGAQTATASEQLRLGAAQPAPAAAAPPTAAPRLNQGSVPAKNPGGNPDKRDCLGLPTPAEVIKCTEKK
jgi:hypothetical protein